MMNGHIEVFFSDRDMDVHFFPQFPFNRFMLGLTGLDFPTGEFILKADVVELPLSPFHAENLSVIF